MRRLILRLLSCWWLTTLAVFCAPAAAEDAEVVDLIARGDRDGAIRALDRAWDSLVQNPADNAGFEQMRSAARSYRTLGVRSRAAQLLDSLVEHAASARPDALPGLLLELGEVQGEAERYGEAASTYARLLSVETKPTTRSQLLILFLKAEVRGRDRRDELARAITEFTELRTTGAVAAGCGDLLKVAGALLRSRWAAQHASTIRTLLDDAGRLQTDAQRHYVLGYRAWLAETRGDHARAVELARTAAIEAMRVEPGAAYRWLWVAGRGLRVQGRDTEALAAYRESVRLLQEHRPVSAGFQVFRERVFPVYGGLLELLLDAARVADGRRAQPLLAEVREILEGFNETEVLDYFAGDCVLPATGTELASVGADTAVVYQFVLEDATVVLANLPDGLHVYKQEIGALELRALADEFREALIELVDEEELNELGLELHAALFAALEADLEAFEIKRLVFVPTGILRTIPMGAVHDGERYLLERYELASTLGLSLTDGGTAAADGRVFFGGVSEAVGGFSALPAVVEEIDSVQAATGGDVLLDADFTAESAAERLASGGYSGVHIATHGVFEREVSSSFLLTYDGRLTLHRLQETIGVRRYLDQPIDLLVLSACESAAGDEKAALGLAGVSLKAGARSTLATLWEISDSGTFRLMRDFYAHLQDGKGKSEALRLAQLALKGDERYAHPNFWSPYVLIGSWR